MYDKDLKILNLQAKLSAAYVHLHTLTADDETHSDNCSREWQYIDGEYGFGVDCDCINIDIREAKKFLEANTDDIQQLIIPIYDI